MALALAKELLPALPASTLPSPLDSPAVSYAKDMDNDEVIAWPQTIKAYVMDIDRYPQPRLPDFLIDGRQLGRGTGEQGEGKGVGDERKETGEGGRAESGAGRVDGLYGKEVGGKRGKGGEGEREGRD